MPGMRRHRSLRRQRLKSSLELSRLQPGGDVVELVRHLDSCDFLTAIETITGEKGLDNNTKQRPDPERERQLAQQRERCAKQERQDIAGQLQRAEQAWQEASLTPVRPRSMESGGLRWHPACPWELGTKACVMARYTDTVTGEPRGIWRRPITGEKPKTLGPMGNCVIRLWMAHRVQRPHEKINHALVLGGDQGIGKDTLLEPVQRLRRHHHH